MTVIFTLPHFVKHPTVLMHTADVLKFNCSEFWGFSGCEVSNMPFNRMAVGATPQSYLNICPWYCRNSQFKKNFSTDFHNKGYYYLPLKSINQFANAKLLYTYECNVKDINTVFLVIVVVMWQCSSI